MAKGASVNLRKLIEKGGGWGVLESLYGCLYHSGDGCYARTKGLKTKYNSLEWMKREGVH